MFVIELHCVSQFPTFTVSVTLSNYNRFSKFWKSATIWQSYREFKGGTIFETHCRCKLYLVEKLHSLASERLRYMPKVATVYNLNV